MNRILVALSASALCSLAACGDDPKPVPDTVSITLFAAAPDAIESGQSTRLLFAIEPAGATASIAGVGDVSGKTEVPVMPTQTTTYHLTATKGTATAAHDVTVTVGPQTATGLKLESASATPTAGAAVMVTITAVAANGKPAVGFRGTVHLTSSDAKAVLPADLVFTASDAGVKQAPVTLETAGVATVTGADTTNATRQATATVAVQPGAATAYELSALPATAGAGEALALAITARDVFGNVATGYTGQVALTSDDPRAALPGAGGFTAGVRTVSLAFGKVGSHTATVADVATTITSVTTSSVVVSAGSPVRMAVAATNATTTAGTAEPFTATVFDAFDNQCTNYRGTVHFAASDASADVPADFAFTAGDAGTHTFSATLKTAGTQSVALSDTVVSGLAGSVAWNVGAATAANCVVSQAPAASTAGAAVGVSVVFRDTFGNQATSFAGTVKLTATDARAVLPPDVTYVPLVDGGSHAFSAQLLSTGLQTLTATDTGNAANHCDAVLTITPAAPKILLSALGSTNAGFAVAVGVVIHDIFDNAIPGFTGTVNFASTDSGAGAVTPAPLVFAGSEGGVSSTSATFVTLGTQTLTASASGSGAGTAAVAVHGLVYTAPTTGRVRLVKNAGQSNAQVVQLDLVANERLEMSAFFANTPGSYAAGMNLPLDTTRVGGDATLFIPGTALPAGAGTRAAAGAIGTSDHVLYAAVSRKRPTPAPPTATFAATDVPAGGVFFSVRLRLTQTGTVGPVFDGTQPLPLFRAAVRDQFGDDFVNQGDFGLGKLEIQ